ncbi:hypothetical protein TNCV_2534731 [Trichonephila clavipes]|nr:hypothetical protein TNCV_2534731 [Trichonephila clavipes]
MNDDRLTFFSKFVQWLDCWKNLKQNKREGCLSEETFFALRHTVNTIPELIKYLLTEQNFKYVLTGKFQTDSLEARFRPSDLEFMNRHKQHEPGDHDHSAIASATSTVQSGRGSLMMVTDAWSACLEFEPRTAENPPSRGSNALPLVWCGS